MAGRAKRKRPMTDVASLPASHWRKRAAQIEHYADQLDDVTERAAMMFIVNRFKGLAEEVATKRSNDGRRLQAIRHRCKWT
jgi:hypothetical protein